MKKNYILFIFTFALLTPLLTTGQSIATYDISFSSNWNSIDHGTLPNNPHWSKLVGATHNDLVTFLKNGEMASQGIQDVAEFGSNVEIMSEVTAAINNNNADQWLEESFSNGALGSATMTNIEVSEDFPLLSLVSMIAPSPDWFIGINGFSFLNGGNNWKTGTIFIDLFPYDAGTDSGSNYESSDLVTAPQQNISGLANVAPFGSNKIGTLTITFKAVLGIDDTNSIKNITIFPNPTKDKITIANIQNKNINTIEVYSILGQLVDNRNIKEGLNSVDLNLESLDSGIYLLKVNSTEGHSTTQKLVIK